MILRIDDRLVRTIGRVRKPGRLPRRPPADEVLADNRAERPEPKPHHEHDATQAAPVDFAASPVVVKKYRKKHLVLASIFLGFTIVSLVGAIWLQLWVLLLVVPFSGYMTWQSAQTAYYTSRRWARFDEVGLRMNSIRGKDETIPWDDIVLISAAKQNDGHHVCVVQVDRLEGKDVSVALTETAEEMDAIVARIGPIAAKHATPVLMAGERLSAGARAHVRGDRGAKVTARLSRAPLYVGRVNVRMLGMAVPMAFIFFNALTPKDFLRSVGGQLVYGVLGLLVIGSGQYSSYSENHSYVEYDDSGILMRRPHRTTFVPWDDVTSISVMGDGPSHFLQLHRHGTAKPLAVPNSMTPIPDHLQILLDHLAPIVGQRAIPVDLGNLEIGPDGDPPPGDGPG